MRFNERSANTEDVHWLLKEHRRGRGQADKVGTSAEIWTKAGWGHWAMQERQCVTARWFKWNTLGQMPGCECEQVSRERMLKGFISMQKRRFPTIFMPLPKVDMLTTYWGLRRKLLVAGRAGPGVADAPSPIQVPPCLKGSLFWHICHP